MSDYLFYIELADGHQMEVDIWAACKLQAYEDLIEYCKDCGIDPHEVRVVDLLVNTPEEEEDEDMVG